MDVVILLIFGSSKFFKQHLILITDRFLQLIYELHDSLFDQYAHLCLSHQLILKVVWFSSLIDMLVRQDIKFVFTFHLKQEFRYIDICVNHERLKSSLLTQSLFYIHEKSSLVFGSVFHFNLSIPLFLVTHLQIDFEEYSVSSKIFHLRFQ